jgi:2-C-methyl-D-erythritol 4-phosphate cytidylyltransferase
VKPDEAPAFAAVLVMAGSGTRLGAAVPKAFVPLGGKPMWRYAAEMFASIESCREVVLVIPPEMPLKEAGAHLFDEMEDPGNGGVVVSGGARRQDSVRRGLAAVSPGIDIVAIHDAARPFVAAETIVTAVAEAARTGAALVAAPVRDTIKRVKAGVIAETLDRSDLWLAQTPQCFRLDLIRAAHEAAEKDGWDVTDDCALLERLGHAVAVVRGDAWNFKITEPEDLVAAEAYLTWRGRPRKESS